MCDDYIFLSSDPTAHLKVQESELLRSFERTLTAEEKEDCRKYVQYLKWPTQTTQERQNLNLAMMCFIDGQRSQKMKISLGIVTPPIYNAFVEVATEELVKWSGMALDTVKTMLTRKVYDFLQKPKA